MTLQSTDQIGHMIRNAVVFNIKNVLSEIQNRVKRFKSESG